MKYNVLLADSDVIFFQNPYQYFKAEPFKDLVILNQQVMQQCAVVGDCTALRLHR